MVLRGRRVVEWVRGGHGPGPGSDQSTRRTVMVLFNYCLRFKLGC
jgi:hypothetical protein